MADGVEPVEAGGLRCVIYIRPSRELIAQSWRWPARWHTAFEQTVGQLGRAVAICILSGLPLTERQLSMQLSIGCVRFGVRHRGSSIYIAVSEFTGPGTPGPDAPGPGGGRQQPHPAHGLALGLRGSGKSFHLVVFQGYMPPIPALGLALHRMSENQVHRGGSTTLGQNTPTDAVGINFDPRWLVLGGDPRKGAASIWSMGKDGRCASNPNVHASTGYELRKNFTPCRRLNPPSSFFLFSACHGWASVDRFDRCLATGKPEPDGADSPHLYRSLSSPGLLGGREGVDSAALGRRTALPEPRTISDSASWPLSH